MAASIFCEVQPVTFIALASRRLSGTARVALDQGRARSWWHQTRFESGVRMCQRRHSLRDRLTVVSVQDRVGCQDGDCGAGRVEPGGGADERISQVCKAGFHFFSRAGLGAAGGAQGLIDQQHRGIDGEARSVAAIKPAVAVRARRSLAVRTGSAAVGGLRAAVYVLVGGGALGEPAFSLDERGDGGNPFYAAVAAFPD